MTVQSIRIKRDSELLVSANNQLEELYRQQHDPCLALYISRNYSLLQSHNTNEKQQRQWQAKAQFWRKLYCASRPQKIRAFFMDEYETGLSFI